MCFGIQGSDSSGASRTIPIGPPDRHDAVPAPRTFPGEPHMSTSTPTGRDQQSFAETALRLGGKTEEEARRTGALDKADDQVEALFKERYQTANSPVHKAVWSGRVPLDQFTPPPLPASAPCDAAMERSFAVVRRRKEAGTFY